MEAPTLWMKLVWYTSWIVEEKWKVRGGFGSESKWVDKSYHFQDSDRTLSTLFT